MTVELEEFYQHRYGGLYFTESVSTHTGTKERLVNYVHMYPFEEDHWSRPINEWTEDRFRKVTYAEALEIMKKDRQQFQEEIIQAKTAAKNK